MQYPLKNVYVLYIRDAPLDFQDFFHKGAEIIYVIFKGRIYPTILGLGLG